MSVSTLKSAHISKEAQVRQRRGVKEKEWGRREKKVHGRGGRGRKREGGVDETEVWREERK